LQLLEALPRGEVAQNGYRVRHLAAGVVDLAGAGGVLDFAFRGRIVQVKRFVLAIEE